KRTEALAELDPRVDDVAHVGAPRIGDDAAVAERTRAPLHPSLEPADDPAVGNLRGGPVVERRFVVPRAPHAGALGNRGALAVERRHNRAIVERRTPVAVLHHERARPPFNLVPRVERGAERGAVVAGGGLDEDVAKPGLLAN